jgi:hypothetical protein
MDDGWIAAPQLRDRGPRVRLHVRLPVSEEEARRRRGQTVPRPYPAEALIDTGSGRTIISRDVARALALAPVGAVEIDTPSSVDLEAKEYRVRFEFGADPGEEIIALEAPLPVPGLDALIGRDLLAGAVLTYDGPRTRFRLAR